MADPRFVHLRVHSEFSITEGMVRIDELVAKAAADRMGAVAVTDLGNLFGMVKFYAAARSAGVKPIVGVDVWITNDADRDKPSRALLLARNRHGYLRLCDLLTRAWLTNQHRGRAELRKAWLTDGGAAGLVVLSGGQAGDVGQALALGNVAAAERCARDWADLAPNAFYLELQRCGQPQAEAYIDAALSLASRLGLPVVATHPVQFLRPEEFKAHEARVCIAEGYILSDQRRPRVYTEACWFKPQAEMAQLFADIPEALANSVEIAKRCSLALELGKSRLPEFPTPPGVTLDEYLVQQAHVGLARRLEELYPSPEMREREAPRYRERLAFEADTINRMGFAGYFLIVADFINWAKSNGVPVGPGRGSGAGSLVAYSLGITDLDPLRYGLLFERFLNPERVSMPDFDIDFCQDGRDRVIEYVRAKYGADSVSQIATFGTMAAKAVVRDVGRVMDWGYGRTDELAKLIPFQPGKLITLQMARAMEPRLAEREANEEDTRALLALAEQLEGLSRNVGMHAGGVLIAPGKLTDFCPLYSATGADGVVSQFDKDDVEAIGLVKFDFLGLTTLTILDWTLRFLRRLDPGCDVTLQALPLDDPTAYRIFQTANTTAVFQFESPGMRRMLVGARPDRFEDLIALVSLYRPGPMDLIPDFIDRKHGRQKVEYLDPRLEPILGQTYGIMVYQEQVMQIAQVIGGYTLGGADLLRRAMGKKKPEEMAKHREIFAAGAAKNDVTPERANQLFDLMEKFAGYGFNKCVVGSTVVTDADTGRRWTVAELFARRGRERISVHALDERWKLGVRPVRDVVWNGRRPVFELRTALGKRLRATGNHPLRCLDGWKTLDTLRPGDRIAAPRQLVVEGRPLWGRHQLVALGGLLSEGNTCHPTCLYYYNNDAALIADFVAAITAFPHSVARVTTRGNGRMEVCVSTGRDTRFRPGVRASVAQPVPALPTCSGLFEWTSEVGILGMKADRKRVPAGAFELDDASIALLMGRLWSGDGFYANATNTVPFYATSSEGLALDVQQLLLRLGIVTRLQRKVFRYRGGERPGYAVFLIGDGAVDRFLTLVVPHCVGREASVAALRTYVEQRSPGLSSKDTLPAGVRGEVDRARREHRLTWKALEGASGVATRELMGRGSGGKRGFRRATVAKLAAFLGNDALRAHAESDVYWDTVVEVVPCGIEDVYDLEVEGDHNFIADGLVVHNSHAAAYALVAYQTAWFKAHHPAAFMAANLSAVMDDTDKVHVLFEDAKANGLTILPPDVNASEYRFVPVDARTIRYGLGGIKGTGETAIAKIIEARAQGGPFRDLFELCARTDKRLVNRRVIESLVRAGAFDAIDPQRSRLFATVGRAIDAAEQAERNAQQASLFGGGGAEERLVGELVPARPWDIRETLKEEKAALGFWLSDHLFNYFRGELRSFARTPLGKLVASNDYGEQRTQILAGIVESVRWTKTASGRMLIVMLSDDSGRVEITVYSEVLEQHRDVVKEDAPLVVEAKVRQIRRSGGDEGEETFLRVTAERLYDLAAARGRFARGLRLSIKGEAAPPGAEGPPPALTRLRALLTPHRNGPLPVQIRYSNGRAECELRLGDEWRVTPNELLIQQLEDWLKRENVEVVY